MGRKRLEMSRHDPLALVLCARQIWNAFTGFELHTRRFVASMYLRMLRLCGQIPDSNLPSPRQSCTF